MAVRPLVRTNASRMMDPGRFCFMVMPFGRKSSQADPGKGRAEIDCNALWDRAFFPVLKELGYQPVRADQETGSLIVNQMLERLDFSDLVIADLTIPNGNVYYEIGIRHAASTGGRSLHARPAGPDAPRGSVRPRRSAQGRGDRRHGAARGRRRVEAPVHARQSRDQPRAGDRPCRTRPPACGPRRPEAPAIAGDTRQ